MERTAKHFRKRDAILTCVRQTTVHPSADWVYARLKTAYPDLSLGTVYRNLSYFKDQGLIASLGAVNGVERFDGNTAPHVHYICTCCGNVLDLHDIRVPQELRGAAEALSGGSVSGCRLTFTGICGSCQNLSEEAIT
ncbi:MAG: transcriptional repressor [Firmicutes bacterium]|nr:transcriptional repressor [Bacillota bacterium]